MLEFVQAVRTNIMKRMLLEHIYEVQCKCRNLGMHNSAGKQVCGTCVNGRHGNSEQFHLAL